MFNFIYKSFLLIIVLTISMSMRAQEETFTVSGRVNVEKPTGRVYVILCDEETFNTETGIDTVSFWINYDKTKVEYEFRDLPMGEYAIRCYQDVNGNHKMDKWLFGPREPWGYSYTRDMKFPPKFDDVSFMLGYNLRINITLGN